MKEIKNFSVEGIIVASDKYLPRTRDNYVRLLITDMRDEGYVPVLDLDPNITVDFVPDTGVFLMSVVVYGVKVGIEKSWEYEGMTANKLIPKSTPKNK
jgi:hypothetical protein